MADNEVNARRTMPEPQRFAALCKQPCFARARFRWFERRVETFANRATSSHSARLTRACPEMTRNGPSTTIPLALYSLARQWTRTRIRPRKPPLQSLMQFVRKRQSSQQTARRIEHAVT